MSCYTSFAPPVREKTGKARLLPLAAAFPALATRVPSAHLFTRAHFARGSHTGSGNRNKCTLPCEHTTTHNCICKSRATYVNQTNIYCSLCMVENLMNIRQAHQACAMNTNKDIIYTEERIKSRFKTSPYLLLANSGECTF